MDNPLAHLRQLLSGEATTNAWWQMVALLETMSESEQAIHLQYVLGHMKDDVRWKGVNVPCGDWGKAAPGWKWSYVEKSPIPSLSSGKMVYCPPGTFTMGASNALCDFDSELQRKREVTLTRGFWIMDTLFTEEMLDSLLGLQVVSLFGEEELPLIAQSWSIAIELCNELSDAAGLEKAYEPVPEETLPYFENLTTLGLPRRILNRLSEGGIAWVGELVQKTEEELLAIPNFGHKMLATLKEHLSQRSFSLEQELKWWPPVACDGWMWKGPDCPGFRLPTEAEWEYAGRAGSTVELVENPEEVAWFADNSQFSTQPVAQKEPNAWGLYDMLGNAQEWCVDSFYARPSPKQPLVNPVGTGIGTERVLRGTSFQDPRTSQHLGSRTWMDTFESENFIGFRMVRTATV